MSKEKAKAKSPHNTEANKARMRKKFPWTFQGIPDFPRLPSPEQKPRVSFSGPVAGDMQKHPGPIFQVIALPGVIIESTLHHGAAVSAFDSCRGNCELRKISPRGFSVLQSK